jgi:hypothetical protein
MNLAQQTYLQTAPERERICAHYALLKGSSESAKQPEGTARETIPILKAESALAPISPPSSFMTWCRVCLSIVLKHVNMFSQTIFV